MIGTTEIIVIAVVVLLLFGASAVPRFARSLGQAKAEFEKGLRDGAKPEPPSAATGPQSASTPAANAAENATPAPRARGRRQ